MWASPPWNRGKCPLIFALIGHGLITPGYEPMALVPHGKFGYHRLRLYRVGRGVPTIPFFLALLLIVTGLIMRAYGLGVSSRHRPASDRIPLKIFTGSRLVWE